ncbi:MAG: hypothetical protein RLZZ227_2089, partial [Pseudomonadota bacterium]
MAGGLWMNVSALLPLLQNASLLLAMVVICAFISSRLSHDSGLKPANDVRLRILTGLLVGLLAVAVIATPVVHAQGIPLDTRSILISLTALFLGSISAIVAMALALMYCVYLGGPALISGVLIILGAGGVGLLWRRYSHSLRDQLSLRELYLFGLVVHAVMLGAMLALPRASLATVYADAGAAILLMFPLATVCVGSLLAHYRREERVSCLAQKSEQRLRLALAASGQELLELNLQTGHVASISREDRARLFSDMPDHQSIHSILGDMYADDAVRVGKVFKEMAEGLRAQWQGEFRMRRNAGNYAWFHFAGKLVASDNEGRPLLMLGTYLDITDRKQDAESLRVFRALIDHTQEAIEVADPVTGRYLDVNASACQELGYTREELLQLTILDVDKTLRAEMLSGGTERLRSGALQNWHGEHVRKDGSTYPVEVSLKYVQLSRDYVVAVVRDVSERHKVEEALKLAALVYDNSHEAMMVMDADTTIIDVNPTFTTMTGYEKSEILGNKPEFLRSGRQTPEFYSTMWEAARATGDWA